MERGIQRVHLGDPRAGFALGAASSSPRTALASPRAAPRTYTGACIRGEFVLEGVDPIAWGLYVAMIMSLYLGAQPDWVA